jgi:hypothetical protein
MTLVQLAGITRTVSGPDAFRMYRRERDELHPGQAEVVARMCSSFGIWAMGLTALSLPREDMRVPQGRESLTV